MASHPDYAGLISWHRSRATGTQVGVYNGEEAGMDTDGGNAPWSTVCEDHAGVCTHATRALALAHAPYPNEWCPTCQVGQ
jgi:hypothetical protein